MLNRYFIHLAYDGTRFHGWQRQPNGLSVQQSLEEALSVIWSVPVAITGAGRTDTGVHASDYYAHVDNGHLFSFQELKKLTYRLNGCLGGDIVVFAVFQVPEDAHARFSALSRTYRYCIARQRDPFRRAFTHFYHGPLDIDIMNRGAERLLTVDDFTSFSKKDTDTKTNICRVTEARWKEEGCELVFSITADRFLRNMVRAVTGTLLDLGKGRITLQDLDAIILSKDRSAAGQSAPAKGLILSRIEYPETVFRMAGERTWPRDVNSHWRSLPSG